MDGNRKTYNESLLAIINDTSKFKLLDGDITVKREGQLQRLLRKLKKDGVIDSNIYPQIYPSGSRPARLYGLPKIHKCKFDNEIPPFRPIVSSIGAYNYNLSKYLSNLLKPHIPMTHCTQDTFSFVKEINQVRTNDLFFVSYDVVSLFTNIPLKDTIELAVDYVIKNNPNLKLTKGDLNKLFHIATAQTHFLFNGAYYDQIDGVAMGSPLAPVLANLYLGHHEQKWLKDYKGVSPVFYKRYVDDVIALFNNPEEAELFLGYLNQQNNSIKFTMEEENNHKIAFLDVLVDNTGDKIRTSVYRKKTFTGVLTNYLSFTCFSYKLSLVRCLIDRAYKINNTWLGFHSDISGICDFLKKNLYPESLLSKTVKAYLNKKLGENEGKNNIVEVVNVRYFKLPYIGEYSKVCAKKLKKLCKTFCKEDTDIKLVFTAFKLARMFSTKDPVPKNLLSSVIYKFVCAGCESSYIGQTGRHISTRIKEHLSTDKKSHVFKHLAKNANCKTSTSDSCFSILDRASTEYERKVKEGLYIGWEKPELNRQKFHLFSTLGL